MDNRKTSSFHWAEQQQQQQQGNNPTIQPTELPPFTYGFETDNQEYYPKDVYYNFTSPVSLQYRESMSSSGSSLSRHSTLSSINTTFSAIEPTETCSYPASYFIPCFPLNNSHDKTNEYHYVVPIFAKAGKKHAQMMQFLFNYDDPNAEETKEGYERTMSWSIPSKKKNYLVTLSHFTFDKNRLGEAHLSHLGKRLGITSILLLIPLKEIHKMDLLFDNLIKSMSDNKSQDDDEWWSRVILIIDQPVEDMADMASKRKNILYQVIPEIQKKYHLSKPLSLLFLNSNNDDGKCREILWQMLEKHNQHGRYTGEIQLNDDIDSTSSDEDDSPFQTVIEYIDGVRKKEPKRKNVLLKRQVQKLHSYDDTAAP